MTPGQDDIFDRVREWANAPSSTASGPAPHACNCIGCCRECGMCRTNPRHTPDACRTVKGLREDLAEAIAGIPAPTKPVTGDG
jgi:hypothetical protein